MASKFRITIEQALGTFPEYMEEKHGVVIHAATQTMDDIKTLALNAGRSSIAAAGFSTRMQRALRGQRYPERGESIDASVFIWHRAAYANVFEDGAIVRGNPMMWIPMGLPPRLGRQATTPTRVAAAGVKLISLKSKKGTPLLGARVRVNGKRREAAVTERNYPWALIKKGTEGKRGHIVTLPLFHGVKMITQKKKWGVREAAAAATNAIPATFTQNFISAQAESNG